jgi:hypothetical protein
MYVIVIKPHLAAKIAYTVEGHDTVLLCTVSYLAILSSPNGRPSMASVGICSLHALLCMCICISLHV